MFYHAPLCSARDKAKQNWVWLGLHVCVLFACVCKSMGMPLCMRMCKFVVGWVDGGVSPSSPNHNKEPKCASPNKIRFQGSRITA